MKAPSLTTASLTSLTTTMNETMNEESHNLGKITRTVYTTRYLLHFNLQVQLSFKPLNG